ncbi:MAG: B12-binding domain-containing radical SAM protein, partial [Planctomycetota bacterium]
MTLIYPSISKRERYGSKIGASGGTQQPLGIAYLGAYLRAEGFTVQLIDAETEGLTHEDILQRAVSFGTDVFGISATTLVFAKAVSLAEYLKKEATGVPIVVGGPHVSGSPRESMQHECFDVAVIGEGEVTFSEVLRAYRDGAGLEGIDGVVFRRNGKLVRNAPRKRIENLNELPFPARDLLPSLDNYLPPPLNYREVPCATIITTRGCPHGCTFCDHNTFGRKYRMRSAENIVAEIRHLIETYSVREIAFVDDTFNINDARLNRLFELMKESGIRLPWTCMARTDTASHEQLQAMKEAGCWHISFGIESGDERIIRLIKKGIDLDHTRKVIAWCRELGIRSKGFFILGHPGETEATIEDTVRYALGTRLTDVVVTLNTPLPGSWNYDNIERFGRMETTDWSKHSMWIPVFVP